MALPSLSRGIRCNGKMLNLVKAHLYPCGIIWLLLYIRCYENYSVSVLNIYVTECGN
jgi:hypothetical protein